MTMPDSLVLVDALFGAEDRLRQNGEGLFSMPSRSKMALVSVMRASIAVRKFERSFQVRTDLRHFLLNDGHVSIC